ncbi:Crp/Fnr family transcriptional regulator [Rhizobium sp. L1K21]|uniref:Crp/Fnr family transcriptional regulator n=1 Tax=Rhizobium sp. L1K21 TaxID=2954933 RepID=UPI002093FE0F|nr:Crp/Fnr family transcriptional regulator [Rhizobium sp. L1K21]MCO6184665.1 Crp/Fnr family transcriptional regulator [Rhizobium sp. L1K21]
MEETVKLPKTGCESCSLRELKGYRTFSSPAEAKFIAKFKSGELNCEPGTTIAAEGSFSPHLFTVLDGWGFRYKTMEDGRRQVINFIVPGDLVGLQGAILDQMDHSVEALTKMRLCIFERDRVFSLFEKHAQLAFDITWLAAREEFMLDEHLLSVGRRTALERAAYLLAFLYERGTASGLISPKKTHLPVTQDLIADMLGLSLVHTNKTLRKLADQKLISWQDKGCNVLDQEGLCTVAEWTPPEEGEPRPFL